MRSRRRMYCGVGFVMMALIAAAPLFLSPRRESVQLSAFSGRGRAPTEKDAPKPPPIYLGVGRPLLSHEPRLQAETQEIAESPIAMSPIGPLVETIAAASSVARGAGTGGSWSAGFHGSAFLRFPELTVSYNASTSLAKISRQYPESQFALGGSAGGGTSSRPGSPGTPAPDLWSLFPDGQGIKAVHTPDLNASPIYPPFALPPVASTTHPEAIPEPAALLPLCITLLACMSRRRRA